ncbi:MAG: hypothetical protein Kow006_32820 [Gammaproteobacteria bacterium]
MDDWIKDGYTLEHRIKIGDFWVSPKYLVNIDEDNKGYQRYHYKKPNIYGRYCHYHFVVNKQTREIVGWGFDRDKSNPEMECGISGG